MGRFTRPDAPDQATWNPWGDPGIRVFSVCLFMRLLHSVWSDWLMKTRLFGASLSQAKFCQFPPIFCEGGQEGGSGLIGFAQVQGMEKATWASNCCSNNFSPLLPPPPLPDVLGGASPDLWGLQCSPGKSLFYPQCWLRVQLGSDESTATCLATTFSCYVSPTYCPSPCSFMS